MPLNIGLPGYTLESMSFKDNFLTHYNALADDNKTAYTITEFNPSYMVNRTESGEMEIVSRFANEYTAALNKYIKMAKAMQKMNNASITPVEDVIEYNNTAYAVRKVNDLPTLGTYMSGKRMDLREAYLFIRPLFLYLAGAQRDELLFSFNEKDLRVNRYGQLVLDGMFVWEIHLHATLVDMMKLYFQLITGKVYDPAIPSIQSYGLTLPPKVETLLNEVFTGDIAYGSIDDFLKKFKSVVDVGGARSGGDGNSDGRLSGILKWAAVCLGAVLFVALGFALYFYLLPAYRDLHPGLANPNFILEPEPMPPSHERTRDFFAVAYTHQRDGGDILNGAFNLHRGSLYYRGYDNGFCLMVRGPGGSEQALVKNVRPSFITVSDDYIYFVDTLSGNQIYRTTLSGGQAELLSSNCALYLQLDGKYLYYTNHDDLDRLYRINLDTKEDASFINHAAYENTMDGSRIIFTNGSWDFNIFSFDTAAEEPRLVRLNHANSANLRFSNHVLYFLAGNEIRAMRTDGYPVAINCPIAAYGFHPIRNMLVVIEEETYRVYVYDITTGEQTPLSGNFQAAYVWAEGNTVYAVDYWNNRNIRTFDLP
jgi:hypothetical protein